MARAVTYKLSVFATCRTSRTSHTKDDRDDILPPTILSILARFNGLRFHGQRGAQLERLGFRDDELLAVVKKNSIKRDSEDLTPIVL